MARAILLVLDSVGIGGAPDAGKYGNEGANTLGHIQEFFRERGGALTLPNLADLGLWHALAASVPCSVPIPGHSPRALWGVAREQSAGKDTTTGHWEIACAPPSSDFGYFPTTVPCFPEELTQAIISQGHLPGILGNCHASGTEIIPQLGAEHLRTRKPILYTSADSVIQIAAHEDGFGLDRLYALCSLTRRMADRLMVSRVIARPFDGAPGSFRRTRNRRDFSMSPFSPTVLDDLCAAGRHVTGVGKISDIFAGRGICESRKASGIEETFRRTVEAFGDLPDGGLIFSNIVEFDSEFGHRRDPEGYGRALEQFDRLLPELVGKLTRGDLLIVTADHGNDPTWSGTDHTREQVPVLIASPSIRGGPLGTCSFSDIGATIAAHLGIAASGPGHDRLSTL